VSSALFRGGAAMRHARVLTGLITAASRKWHDGAGTHQDRPAARRMPWPHPCEPGSWAPARPGPPWRSPAAGRRRRPPSRWRRPDPELDLAPRPPARYLANRPGTGTQPVPAGPRPRPV